MNALNYVLAKREWEAADMRRKNGMPAKNEAESAPMSAGGRALIGEGTKVAIICILAGCFLGFVVYMGVMILGPMPTFGVLAAWIIALHRIVTRHVTEASDDVVFANASTFIGVVALIGAALLVWLVA